MSDFLRISIVTPVYNGVEFLETMLQSIAGQQVASLEHIVIDGGSSDGSVDVIKRHEDRLSTWVSEPDNGMYDAINKGFQRSSGDIMGWLNADDLYFPWTLQLVEEIFLSFPDVEWISSLNPILINEKNQPIYQRQIKGFSKAAFDLGMYLLGKHPDSTGHIQQESTFWRRSLWERAGSKVDSVYRLAGDFELWARFFQHAPLFGIQAPLAAFRAHPSQLTSQHMATYQEEANRIFYAYQGHSPRRIYRLGRRFFSKRWPGISWRLGWLHWAPVIKYNLVQQAWRQSNVLV